MKIKIKIVKPIAPHVSVVEPIAPHVSVVEPIAPHVSVVEPLLNKGTGAGGKNTNVNGLKFEDKTNNERQLYNQGFKKTILNNRSKTGYYLSKTFEDKEIVYTTKAGFKLYMNKLYNINEDDISREPDEAYIIKYNDGRTIIKILEKKNQNVDGSVEDKLMNGPTFLRWYQKLFGINFEIQYGYCVSQFLKKKLALPCKKYSILNEIYIEDKIVVLFGDDPDYFEQVDRWIKSS